MSSSHGAEALVVHADPAGCEAADAPAVDGDVLEFEAELVRRELGRGGSIQSWVHHAVRW